MNTRPAFPHEFDPPLGSSPAEVKAAFLRRLPADFCPRESWVATVNARAGTTASVTPDARAVDATDTAAAVDAFAESYWKLDPTVRRAEWERLSARTADAPTSAFLEHLESGLGVGEATTDDPEVADLTAVARELFTLRPRPRAVRRIAWLDGRDRAVDWEAAVGRLWATDSATAELDPPLVAFLDTPSSLPTAVQAWSTPADERAYTVTSSHYSPRYERDPEPTPVKSSSSGRWVIVPIALMLIGFLRALILGGSGEPHSSPPAPRYTPPANYRLEPFTPPTVRYDSEKIRELLKQIQSRDLQESGLKTVDPAPPSTSQR